MTLRAVFRVVAAAALSTATLAAQQPAAPDPLAGLPDISGIWNRLDTEGGQSYDGIEFPEAQLHPEFAAKLRPPVYEGLGAPPPGPPPAYDIRAQENPTPRCAVGGGPGTGNTSPNINSAGMSLVASRDLVLMLRDGAQGGRYMFADGRPIPAKLDGPYTIGRWEKDAFVATTRGFNPGMTAFGRGWIEPSTELVETFRPSADGKRLTITYEWRDPKIYVKPLVYQIVFERLPANQQIWESWCDSKLWIDANAKSGAKPAAK
jgi:hypothetical protein